MSSMIDLIGNTPLVEVTRIDCGRCRLFLKLESQNPGASVKDRIGLAMIEAAEADGRLKPGATIVEATAGNTGLALALVAALKGYHIVLVIPDKMSREKVNQVRALGAEVRLTRSDVARGHPEYYQDLAAALAREIPHSFYVNQFDNPHNALAHERTTGPEIMAQTAGQVDAIICGVGSGGTLTGLSRYFAQAQPALELILADPVGSVLAPLVQTGQLPPELGAWQVEGIGEDFVPPLLDLSRVSRAYSISDEESFHWARELLRKEGIFGGSSTGTLLAAAIKYAQEQTVSKNIVSFVCDSGSKYLSRLFDDCWLRDQGFGKQSCFGDLRDLISHRPSEHNVVAIGPDDTLATAFQRMRSYDVSQLPVLNGSTIVGLIDEFDLLTATHNQAANFKAPVQTFMTAALRKLAPGDALDRVQDMLKKGLTVVVEEQGRFLGLITKTDLLQYWRRRLS